MPVAKSRCACGCGRLTTSSDHYYRGHRPQTITRANGCWEWQWAKDKRGYGRMNTGGLTTGFAHRFYYERAKGMVPAGLELDHLCSNPSCVNPDHLEPVTHAENIRRAAKPKKLTGGRLAQVLTLIEQGWSLTDIAAAYGVTKGCVHAHKKRRGIEPAKTVRRPPGPPAADE